MRRPVMINGYKYFLESECGNIVLYSTEKSKTGYSIYSGFITMNERNQIMNSDAYRALKDGLPMPNED